MPLFAFASTKPVQTHAHAQIHTRCSTHMLMHRCTHDAVNTCSCTDTHKMQYTYTPINPYVLLRTHIRTCTCTHMHAHTHTHMHAHIHARMHAHPHAHPHAPWRGCPPSRPARRGSPDHPQGCLLQHLCLRRQARAPWQLVRGAEQSWPAGHTLGRAGCESCLCQGGPVCMCVRMCVHVCVGACICDMCV